MTGILVAAVLMTSAAGQPNLDKLSYRVRPIPKADRTDLEITLRFNTKGKLPQTIKLPIDYYGTADLHRYVTSFEGEGGTIVRAGKAPTERIVEPGKGGEA